MGALNSYLKLFVVVLFASSCVTIRTGYYSDNQIASNAVQIFHELLNSEDYEQIYLLTDQKARKSKNREDLINLLSSVHGKLGRVVKSQQIKSDENSERQIDMVYQTTFEKGERMEHFVWIIEDGKAGLFSYGASEPPTAN